MEVGRLTSKLTSIPAIATWPVRPLGLKVGCLWDWAVACPNANQWAGVGFETRCCHSKSCLLGLECFFLSDCIRLSSVTLVPWPGACPLAGHVPGQGGAWLVLVSYLPV
jgi:hypothetical protein